MLVANSEKPISGQTKLRPPRKKPPVSLDPPLTSHSAITRLRMR
jgi:hypothetical protein